MKVLKSVKLMVVCLATIMTATSCASLKPYFEQISGVFLSSASPYVVATDFGGDIALVGRKNAKRNSEEYSPPRPYICIDTSGNELFSLPNEMIAAWGSSETIAPVNNYIFATDSNDRVDCKYLLNQSGEIILSPEKNNYDAIFVPKNYRKMFYDGYILVYRNNYSYNKSEQLLSCFDLEGNCLFDSKVVFDFDITKRNWPPIYIGDGRLSFDNEFLDLKSGNLSETSLETVDDSANYDFSLSVSENESVVRTIRNRLNDEYNRIYSIYSGYCGVTFYNYDNKTTYLSIVDTYGKLLFEPFKMEKGYKRICVHDNGFILVPESNKYYDSAWEYDMPFYNLQGELLKTVKLKANMSGELEISDYSCGFYKIEIGGQFFNYMDSHGDFLF